MKPIKHIGMIVSYSVVQAIVPPGFSLGIPGRDQIGVAVGAIARYYCDRANMVQLCPQQCQLCLPSLRKMLDVRGGKSPMGLLVWKAKDGVANLRDLAADKKKPAQSHVPTSDLEQTTNPFLDLVRGL